MSPVVIGVLYYANLKGCENMLFRVIARNPNGNDAYAERILGYKLVDDDGTVIVWSLKNETYFARISQILVDPVVIREVSGERLYKVQLED